MDESEKADLDVKGLCLVDFSSENDSLVVDSLSPSCQIDRQRLGKNQNEHRNFEFVEATDALKAYYTANALGHSEQLPQPSESFEPEIRRQNGKCNLRKSLAWDSAFLSGAGVLDPEELSSMMKGVENRGKNLLPGIEEDVNRSTDSFSTLESESLTLEDLETDLFQDIRASIQRSSKASNVACSSRKSVYAGTETEALCFSEKVDPAALNKIKAKPASKKQITGMQGPGRMVKQSSGCPEVTQIKPVARNSNSTSSLSKPPHMIGRANPISMAPSKRASLSASRIKTESDNTKNTTVASKESQASKPPRMGSTSRCVPKPALSSKSSSLGSSTATKEESARSSSMCIGKSPLNSVKRKTNMRTLNPPSSGSILKTPSKIELKNKSQPGRSSVSAPSKLFSSSKSPASSMSSESSSSSSTVNQRSNKLRASLDSNSSSRSFDSDAPPLGLQMHSKDHTSDGCENQVTRQLSQNVMKTSTRVSGLSGAATSKPSGLRMPSPKIGFFDGGKSLVHTTPVGRQSHSGLPSGLPKIGSGLGSPCAGTSKPKLGKVQLATTVSAFRNVKLDTQKPASPVLISDPSNDSTKVSSASSKGVNDCATVSLKVLSKTVLESGLDADEGAKGYDIAKYVSDLGLDAEKNGSLGSDTAKRVLDLSLDAEKNGSLGTVKIEWDICDSSSGSYVDYINPAQKVDEDSNYEQDHLKSNYHSVVENNEKEKDHLDDQVDRSSKHVGTLDEKPEIQEEQFGNSLSLTNLLKLNPSSLSPTSLEITAGTRVPFAVKNSFCNGEGLDLLTGSTVVVVEKSVTFPSLEGAHKENS